MTGRERSRPRGRPIRSGAGMPIRRSQARDAADSGSGGSNASDDGGRTSGRGGVGGLIARRRACRRHREGWGDEARRYGSGRRRRREQVARVGDGLADRADRTVRRVVPSRAGVLGRGCRRTDRRGDQPAQAFRGHHRTGQRGCRSQLHCQRDKRQQQAGDASWPTEHWRCGPFHGEGTIAGLFWVASAPRSCPCPSTLIRSIGTSAPPLGP